MRERSCEDSNDEEESKQEKLSFKLKKENSSVSSYQMEEIKKKDKESIRLSDGMNHKSRMGESSYAKIDPKKVSIGSGVGSASILSPAAGVNEENHLR